MKSLAVKEEEKRIRKHFDYWHTIDKENGFLWCDWFNSKVLTDTQIKKVFDEHLLRRYRRKYKWLKI